jgi:phytanoyl-CoA hydroxylase
LDKLSFNGAGQYRNALTQIVNIWRKDEEFKMLTLHKKIASAATQLAGVPLRIWHDHLLSKRPHNNAATEWHQDRPKWALNGTKANLSAWVALQDTNVEMGCMNFIPGSHRYSDIPDANLLDPKALFRGAPHLEYAESVCVPLKAGDCTFHYGETAHRAGPNLTDKWRIAQTIIYIDAETTLSDQGHLVTNELVRNGELKVGDVIEHENFPRV